MKTGKVLPKVIDNPTVIKEKAVEFEIPDKFGSHKLLNYTLIPKSSISTIISGWKETAGLIMFHTVDRSEFNLDYFDKREYWNDLLRITDFMKSSDESTLRIRKYDDGSIIVEPLFKEGE